MVLFEKIGDDEKHHQQQTQLILKVWFVDDPSIDQGEMFQSDGPDADCFKIDNILAYFVVTPMGDGENQEDESNY